MYVGKCNRMVNAIASRSETLKQVHTWLQSTAVEKWLYVSDLCPSSPALWMPQSAQQHNVACTTHAAPATGTLCGRQMGWHYTRLSSPVFPPKIKKDVIKQEGMHQRQHLAKQTIVLRHFSHSSCGIWQSHSSMPLHSATKWPPTAVTMSPCYHTTSFSLPWLN